MTSELRIKIAESVRPGVRIVALEDREPVWILGDAGFCRGVEREPVPRYDTDANAALQLVEGAGEGGVGVDVGKYRRGAAVNLLSVYEIQSVRFSSR